MCVFYFDCNTKATEVKFRAKSDTLAAGHAALRREVSVLPAPRGGANCVNPQLASMPNIAELDLAPGLLHWRLDVQLSGKPLPHAG